MVNELLLVIHCVIFHFIDAFYIFRFVIENDKLFSNLNINIFMVFTFCNDKSSNFMNFSTIPTF